MTASIATAIMSLTGLSPMHDFLVEDCGDGPVLKAWYSTIAQPSAGDIAAEQARLTANPPVAIDGAVFLARITDAEYTAVTTSTNVSVLRWVETLRMKGVVNLGDATAIAAKAGLVALGLMTQDRADAVFAP